MPNETQGYPSQPKIPEGFVPLSRPGLTDYSNALPFLQGKGRLSSADGSTQVEHLEGNTISFYHPGLEEDVIFYFENGHLTAYKYEGSGAIDGGVTMAFEATVINLTDEKSAPKIRPRRLFHSEEPSPW